MQLRSALYSGMLVTFAQGMALLRVASRTYSYDLNLESIARIWRGGCIIRSVLLDLIAAAFRARPDLTNLLLDPAIGAELSTREADLRSVVSASATHGIPAPGLMSALGYYDSYRSAWLPANLIEAQRDFFGAHGYERIDEEGTFHTEWTND
jgi:6-phosphogluconate dehydrogenase